MFQRAFDKIEKIIFFLTPCKHKYEVVEKIITTYNIHYNLPMNNVEEAKRYTYVSRCIHCGSITIKKIY